MKEKIQILVVDDHPLFRRGVVALLSEQERFEVVGEAGDMGETLRLFGRIKIDVILLDNRLPGVQGIDAIKSLKDVAPETKVVVLTVSDDENDLARSLQNGADAYLLKTTDSEQLCQAIMDVHEGAAVVSPQMQGKLIAALRRLPSVAVSEESSLRGNAVIRHNSAPLSLLSQRELEVFRLVARGQSNKQIADALEIAESTVKVHLQHVFKKLNLRSRVQIALLATTLDWV